MNFSHQKTEFQINRGGAGDTESEYIELLELGGLKPRPILFAVKTKNSGKVTVSMHREGLPYEVFDRFVNEMKKAFCA